MDTQPRRHLAHLPPLTDSPLVFFTACTRDRAPCLARSFAHDILHDLWSQAGERSGWFVGDYVLMPDHVHLFARRALGAVPMHQWVGTWKSLSSRRMGVDGGLWQKDYFDRYLRSGESYTEKWHYVELNPVRAGLVSHLEQWPFKGRIHTLMF